MKVIKPIIGIVSPFGMVEENKSAFKKCSCIIIEVKNISDLENCDCLIFPSSVSSSLFHYVGQGFLDYIFEKNQKEAFPIWVMGQSFSLFAEKFELNLIGKSDSFEEKKVLDFLDVNPINLVFCNSFIFKEKKGFLDFLFKDKLESIYDKNGNICIFKKGTFFATTFSPELSGDLRIYEYFINEFID